MKKVDKQRIGLTLGLLLWLILASVCYALNGYLGIAVVIAGAVIFYMKRHKERKEVEKAAPKDGLYTGLQHGVIYKTQMSIEECLKALSEKSEEDPLEFDFGWNEQDRAGSLALYCKKGGLRPSNFPSSFVVSFSARGDGVWILVRYLDPTAKSSLMTRVDIDGFMKFKCAADAIGMRKPPQEEAGSSK